MKRSSNFGYKAFAKIGMEAKKNLEAMKKDTLPGGKADKKTIEQIAQEQGKSIEFAREQLEIGIQHEKEHTSDPEIASEIALDHLSESLSYYIELEKMERKLDDGKENTINIKSSDTPIEQLQEIIKTADKENKIIIAEVEDDQVEYYQSMGFKIKE